MNHIDIPTEGVQAARKAFVDLLATSPGGLGMSMPVQDFEDAIHDAIEAALPWLAYGICECECHDAGCVPMQRDHHNEQADQ